MLAPFTHVLPLTAIHRERVLPVPGKVLVRAGQSIGAMDDVAEANLTPEYLFLDVARGLGIPAERVAKYLQCEREDQLAEGDVIAGPVGLARRIVRSPKGGRVILADGGIVLLEVAARLFQLKAGIPGTVTDLVPDRGAIIETTGALIQGVWGNGRIDYGVMVVLARAPDQALDTAELDVSMRGAIGLAAYCERAEVLKAAEDLPLRGLILSSLEVDLLPLAAKLPIPVLVIEGFGRRAMNPVAYRLLTTNDRHEVAVNAESWDRYTGARPEAVIPLPAPATVAAPQETGLFELQQQVRVLRPPLAGSVGKLIGFKKMAVFPSGLRTQGGEVQLEDGQKIVLPLANLDVLA